MLRKIRDNGDIVGIRMVYRFFVDCNNFCYINIIRPFFHLDSKFEIVLTFFRIDIVFIVM